MTRKQIGAAIKKHRTSKDISKYKVVKETGMTFGQLSAIEAGSKNYTIDSLLNFLKAIKLKLNEIE